MDLHDLLEQYEATADEAIFVVAKQHYESALANGSVVDASVRLDYGYLLEWHGRNALRAAVREYEQAIALDPSDDRPHYQLIWALAGLQDGDLAARRYSARFESSSDEVRDYRFLAHALLADHQLANATATVDQGLQRWPEDAVLLDVRGRLNAQRGDAESAVRDWRRVLELDRESIGALYSMAFLFERLGRFAEAIEAWQSIVDWNEQRGYELQAEWPRRELTRLREYIYQPP
jgi:tetratricopeptide (TPR) repeat protein